MILRMVYSCHNQRRKVSKHPLPTFINYGKHPVLGTEPWFWMTDMFSPVGPGCHQTFRMFGSGMDIRILDVGLKVAKAYGITNMSSQGMAPVRPFGSRPMFSSKIYHHKRTNIAEYVPSPLVKRLKKARKMTPLG